MEKWEKSNIWHEMSAPCGHMLFVLPIKEATRKLSAALVSYSSNSLHLIYFLRNQSSYLSCMFNMPSISTTLLYKPKKPAI